MATIPLQQTSLPKSSTVASDYEPSQEVRFAVVMYGGVSLAIYIHGVIQELYRLVRATAPKPDTMDCALLADNELIGTERVYRKLGQMLQRNGIKKEVKDNDPIRTRFVVDILSGTSAGGINAIFLAKALANNQHIDQLKQLWLDEGDISLLINDKQSLKGLSGLSLKTPPESLLNSQRMYLILLKAFEDMETKTPSNNEFQSPYVDELDLYITTTDILGIPLPLRLSDKVVNERNHRNRFHFVYRSKHIRDDACNDFHADYNPFLAFAARCTSAFPFAFEPMSLCDIDNVLATFPKYRNNEKYKANSDHWKRFYKDYLQPAEMQTIPFPERAFGDGGYLDNKPFSYATDTLMRRQADVPVDRKLIYIEPSPEYLKDDKVTDRKPDAIKNSTAAIFTLPRYETIREDLQRVLDRNKLVERVNRITQGIEEDVKHGIGKQRPGPKKGKEWADQDLKEMIEQQGITYGSYHRLKIEVITDELAELITLLSGFDEKSDQFLAIRYLVRAWRDNTYIEYYPIPGDIDSKPEGKFTQNRFLLDFDLSYRIRRLNYVRRKLDILSCLDEDAKSILKNSNTDFSNIKGQEEAFRKALKDIKSKLNEAFKKLRTAKHNLSLRSSKNTLYPLIQEISIKPDDLLDLLKKSTDDARLKYANQLLASELPSGRKRKEKLQEISSRLVELLSKAMQDSSQICEEVLDPSGIFNKGSPQQVARECLWHYYQYYDNYDMITFPILYCTEAGETDTVEIIRISPEDAKSLIDEEDERKKQNGRSKLAGTAFANFGAFFERFWRQNDMLWGRLDSAERLITTLLPGDQHKDDRKRLIIEAQEAIIAEELKPQAHQEICKLLADALAGTNSMDKAEKYLQKLIEAECGSPINPKLQAILRSCLNEKKLLSYLRDGYEVNREPNHKTLLTSLSRSSQVIGKMLEGLADKYHKQSNSIAWVTRLSQIFWGLVIVAVPGSILNLLFKHWLKLLYTFEVLLIIFGTVLNNQEMQRLGFVSSGITLAINLIVVLLGSYMRMSGKKRLFRTMITVIIAAIIFFAGVGMDEIFGWGMRHGFLQFIYR